MGPKRIVSGTCAALVAVGALLLAAPAASGGGAVLDTVEEDYAPGEQARAWTGVAWDFNGDLGTPEQGPYEAYLLPLSAEGLPLTAWGGSWPSVPDEALHVGTIRVEMEPYDPGDGFTYGPSSAILDFEVPEVPDGEYEIVHCDDPCTTTLGDITWGSVTVSGSAAPPLSEVPWDEQIARLRLDERLARVGPMPVKALASGEPPRAGAALPGLAVAVLLAVTAVGIWLARRSHRRAELGSAQPHAVQADRLEAEAAVPVHGGVVDPGTDQHLVGASLPSILDGASHEGGGDAPTAVVLPGEEVLDHAHAVDAGGGREEGGELAVAPGAPVAHLR
jgi:hypothetical protein